MKEVTQFIETIDRIEDGTAQSHHISEAVERELNKIKTQINRLLSQAQDEKFLDALENLEIDMQDLPYQLEDGLLLALESCIRLSNSLPIKD